MSDESALASDRVVTFRIRDLCSALADYLAAPFEQRGGKLAAEVADALVRQVYCYVSVVAAYTHWNPDRMLLSEDTLAVPDDADKAQISVVGFLTSVSKSMRDAFVHESAVLCDRVLAWGERVCRVVVCDATEEMKSVALAEFLVVLFDVLSLDVWSTQFGTEDPCVQALFLGRYPHRVLAAFVHFVEHDDHAFWERYAEPSDKYSLYTALYELLMHKRFPMLPESECILVEYGVEGASVFDAIPWYLEQRVGFDDVAEKNAVWTEQVQRAVQEAPVARPCQFSKNGRVYVEPLSATELCELCADNACAFLAAGDDGKWVEVCTSVGQIMEWGNVPEVVLYNVSTTESGRRALFESE